jgi:hypothetical protein
MTYKTSIKMRIILLSLLLLPLQVFAQITFEREQFDVKGAYKKSIREYIARHPDAVYNKMIFLKNHPYTDTISYSMEGVTAKFVDPTNFESLKKSINKKQSFIVLDMPAIVMRDIEAVIWLTPMKVNFDPKKKIVLEPVYDETGCKITFDYGPDRSKFLYKTTECVKFE